MVTVNAKAVLLQLVSSRIVVGHGTMGLLVQLIRKTRGKMALSPSAAYEALRALEAEGLVKGVIGPTQRGMRPGRPACYFMATPEGIRVARENRATAAIIFDLTPKKPVPSARPVPRPLRGGA